MRFAYIDSQGKEVGIPTVEALQLRIELGAITEETIFYDASKDRWDPAGEHEIFRTLSREISERGEEGPRPPAPKVAASGEGSDGKTLERSREDGEVGRPRTKAPDPFEQEQDPLESAPPADEPDWVEAEEVGEPTPPAPDPGSDWGLELGDFGALELAPDLIDAVAEPGVGEPELPQAPEDSGPEPERTADDVAGGLELEAPLAEQGSSVSNVAPDDELELETSFSELGPGPEVGWETPDGGAGESTDFSGTMELEDTGGGEPSTQAPSRRRPSDPVAGDAAEEGGEGGETDAREEAIRQERSRRDPYDRRVQRPRREAPGRRRKRPPPRWRGRPSAGLVLGVVALVALASAGAWFGWSALRGTDTAEASAAAPVLPPLPDDLEPAMRTAASAAYAEMLDTLRAMAARAELPPEPDPDWLAGIYLANAGDYPAVETYWVRLREHLDRVRASDNRIFVDVLRGRMEESGVAVESRDTVRARIVAGFRASAEERQAVYDQLAELVRAATDLHQFLVGNAANIAYEPAAGLSRDPVTEAVPATPELGDEMWGRMEEISTALEGLGTLDRVTTERILAAFHGRLEAVGVR